MRSHADWFTERAAQTWRVAPGRSILGLVPFGCDDAQAAQKISAWIGQHFLPPQIYRNHSPAVVRVVADQGTGTLGFLAALEQSFRREVGELEYSLTADPAERLGDIVEAVHLARRYPVILIERFHAFARVADDGFLALLSRLRSLEHDGEITTVALSPIAYDAIRRQISELLPFVNSAYGDNHDRAVMKPLTLEEFSATAVAAGHDLVEAERLYELGGGPDAVYQALLDEWYQGLANIDARCVMRVHDVLDRFMDSVIGDWAEHRLVYHRIINRAPNAGDDFLLRSLPLAAFLVKATPTGLYFSGRTVELAVQRRLNMDLSDSIAATGEPLRIVVVAADPDGGLDLMEEIRCIEESIGRSDRRHEIVLQSQVSARPEDLVRALTKHRPQIVHFMGHGEREGIFMRDDRGGAASVTGVSLAKVLKGRGVRAVVMNACWSEGYLEPLLNAVDAVICTREALDDDAAVEFSAAFYRAIGDGNPVAQAFRDATDILMLRSLQDCYRLEGAKDIDIWH